MNNQDHISESLETISWVKILKFFYADPGSGIRDGKKIGSGMEKIRIRDGKNSDPEWKKFKSVINIRVTVSTLTSISVFPCGTQFYWFQQ
jgi:hypothetical protein